MNQEQLMGMTADIAAAHLSNNTVAVGDVPTLIRNIHSSLKDLDTPTEAPTPEVVPAVSMRKSIANPEFIISMIDGKKYKMLTRHLSMHGYTPESYREKFGLPKDYPMTAPAYSVKRRQLAISIGLGRKPKGVK